MKKTSIVLVSIFLLMFILSACGKITATQKNEWTTAYNQLETKKQEHNQEIKKIGSFGTSNVAGNILISAGKMTAGAATINVTGNWTNNGGSFVQGTSLV